MRAPAKATPFIVLFFAFLRHGNVDFCVGLFLLFAVLLRIRKKRRDWDFQQLSFVKSGNKLSSMPKVLERLF
jgi:hypothetical protein